MKIRILFVLAICAAILVGGVACKAGSSYGGMTAEQVIKNMEAAALTYKTAHIEGTETMSGIVQESWGDESIMNMVMNITGDIDLENMQMYMNVAATIDTTTDGDTESNTMDVQMYMIDDWMYTGMELLGENIWMKVQLTEEMWEEQRTSMYQGDELLKDAIEINIVGEETVNGVACWKLDVNPDTEKILSWAQTQVEDEMGGLPSDVDFNKMFKDVAVTMWVDEDTYYTTRCDVTMTMDIDGDVMDVSMTVNYSEFNQPVTITLPAEASEAIDFSGLETQK